MPSACARLRVIFNPVAGRRRRRRLDLVSRALAARGVAVTIAETDRPGHAEALAHEAATAGERLIVAAGGDGTIAEVANGLAGSGAALGVIPLGTANVIAHDWGLPFAPEAIAAALVAGRTRPLHPLLARFGDGNTRLVLQMLGVGLDLGGGRSPGREAEAAVRQRGLCARGRAPDFRLALPAPSAPASTAKRRRSPK
ncbi:MAG: acylglycerol kinase family protein [Acetobacteraceae bacterium]|nr:acylglycerol kinase family protein [Acetobacteraceae bacterium]